MLKKLNFVFGLHNHQPVGNHNFILEELYYKAYQPFLDVLAAHPGVKATLHLSGVLLEWILREKSTYYQQLREMVQRGQIELLTGGFYEPVLAVIPDRDKIGQIEKLSNFIGGKFDVKPKGIWLTERVWEPHLTLPLSEAGIEYVIVDSMHFNCAGIGEDKLYGYFITEEQGYTLKAFPINPTIYEMFPWEAPEVLVEYLSSLADETGDKLVVMMANGEKLGGWPGTYHQMYREEWLEKFFTLLEQNAYWLNLTTPSDYMEQHKHVARVYLPTASYNEMMFWSLPTNARLAYENAINELTQENKLDKYKRFLIGGFWRNFLVKYVESNNMHKKMLEVSERVNKSKSSNAVEELWKGQDSCAYWHGGFGGVYLNYLRSAVYSHLIKAEILADKIIKGPDSFIEFIQTDFDKDAQDELILRTNLFNLYIDPGEGGTLFELDFKPVPFNLVDTFTRIKEVYHEGHTNQELNFDSYRRVCLVDHFINLDVGINDFRKGSYEEKGDFVSANYTWNVECLEDGYTVALERLGKVLQNDRYIPVKLKKQITVFRDKNDFFIDYTIQNLSDDKLNMVFGSEFNISLLAGYVEDRYYFVPGKELRDRNLASIGEINAINTLGLRDEWLGMEITMDFADKARTWRFPVESLSFSSSADGLEKLYQHSTIFASWNLNLAHQTEWSTKIIINLKQLLQ